MNRKEIGLGNRQAKTKTQQFLLFIENPFVAVSLFGGAVVLLLIIGSWVDAGWSKTQLQISSPETPYRSIRLDGGLREISIYGYDNGDKLIEVRDLGKCRSTKADCELTRYKVDSGDRFISRESSTFNHGYNTGTGEIVAVGKKEAYIEKMYGVGKQVPYVIKTYANTPDDPRILKEQQRLDSLLKEIPKA